MWPRSWRKYFKVCNKYKIKVGSKVWIASVLFRVYHGYSYAPQASCNRKPVGDTGTLHRSHAEYIHKINTWYRSWLPSEPLMTYLLL